MDPLSISTGIITFVAAANSLLLLCYNIQAELRNSPWTLTRLIQETKALRNLLEAVQGAVAASEAQQKRHHMVPVQAGLYASLQAPLADCVAEVCALDKMLRMFSSDQTGGANPSRLKSLAQAAKWTMSQDEVEKSLTKMERCKNALTLCISSQNMLSLTNIEKLTLSLSVDNATTHSHLENVTELLTRTNIGEQERMVVEWLSPLKPWYNHDAALQTHQNGTSQWFLKSAQFQDWLNQRDCFLWISGPPGAGKTVLLGHVIESITQTIPPRAQGNALPPTAYAIMYCDFKNQDCQSVENVIGSLLGQVYAQLGTFPHEILAEYKKCSEPPFWSRPRSATLMRWIQDVAQKVRLIVSVDALDEHPLGSELFSQLHMLSKGPGRPNVIVTSRNNLQVDKEGPDSLRVSKVRLEDYVTDVDRDIRQYVMARLTADMKLKRWSEDKYRNLVSDVLLSKSNGMFRWVQCQLDALTRVRTPGQIKRALASLPAGLEDTYRQILCDVASEDAELLRKMLTWLSFCTTHLTQAELQEAIAIQAYAEMDEDCRLRDFEDLLSLGNSLVSIFSDGDGRIGLAHLSVRDYLLSASLRQDSRVGYFALASAEGHAELAADCLTYLFSKELQSGPCDTADEYMERLKKLPFLKHAANAWSYHFRSAEPDGDLCDLGLRLFLPEYHAFFMSWIQVIHTGADSNFKWNLYPKHATPLYYAASFGLRSIVQHLLSDNDDDDQAMCPDLNAPGSRFGGTALHAAAIREHLDIIEDLLRAGADPSRADFNMVTPLHSAASQGSVGVVRMLLRFGADVHAKDSMTGLTPVEWARNSGRQSIVALLEAATCGGVSSDSDSSSSASSSAGRLTPGSSNTSSCLSRGSSASSRTATTEEEEPEVWKPAPAYFPDHYEKRSGLDSSIVISYTIGDKSTTLFSTLESTTFHDATNDQRCW